jgi:hypothetical protein
MSIRRESKSESNLETKQKFKFQCFNGIVTRMKSGKDNKRDEDKSKIDSWRANLRNCCYKRKSEIDVVVVNPQNDNPPNDKPPNDNESKDNESTDTVDQIAKLSQLIDELYEANQKFKAEEISFKVKLSFKAHF